MTGAPVGMAGELGDRARSTALESLDERRRRVTEALSDQKGKDLADFTDVEFNDGLRRLKLVQSRMTTILDQVLVEGAHFGNPKDTRGKEAFKKPILLKAGAEELRRLLRYSLRRVAEDQIIETAEYVSVIVTLGIFDSVGRLIATRRASCTTKEKRFLKFDGTGPTFADARECLHVCLAMAEKRAGGLLTCEVSGATAFLANADAMADEEEEDTPVSPWTADEKKRVYEAAAKKRMGRKEIAQLVTDTLGRSQVSSGDEVEMLIAAIGAWERPEKASEASADSGPAPMAAAPPTAPPATEPGEADESEQNALELDKETLARDRTSRK